jgi:multicomponent Na+:H+ antiporter subunit G
MLINIIGGVFISGGLFFLLVGTVGIIRLPDVLSSKAMLLKYHI